MSTGVPVQPLGDDETSARVWVLSGWQAFHAA
jgi:hypothetical protein